MLELIETNSKQAEEIKLLKARLNQAETEALKSRQASNSAQQANTQIVNDKLKKREAEMTQAVLELEAGLRSAKSQLLEVDFLKQQNSELQAAHDTLKAHCIVLEKKYEDMCETNDKLFNDGRSLQSNIDWLEAEVAAQTKRSALLEALVDQKGNENKQILTDCTEQKAKLRQELINHVGNFQKLQQAYDQLTTECNSHKRTIQSLNESIESLKESLREANEQSTVIFGDSDSERGETFQLTTPAEGITTTAGATANKGFVTDALPPINTKVIEEQTKDHEVETEHTFRFQEYLRLKRENKELKMRLADLGGSGSANRSSSSNNGSSGGASGCSLAHSASGISPKGGGTAFTFTSPLPSARQLQSAGASRATTAHGATSSNAPSAGILPSKLRNNVSRKFF